ncbi:MAG TPA: hypothetical protein VEL11_18700 [Candidatus Bathyarchaeia archaeon]|nr:hypothetical protein [Candidatus Bathyarchaeia archaeon]
MNRTTTMIVALIAAAGLTTMVYAVPGTAQQAFAWGHRVVHHNSYQSYPVPYPVPYPVFGGFFVHKTIIQTIHQVNNCTGTGEEQKYGSNHQDENQKDKQTICLNTAVNNAGRGLGANGVGSGNLGNTGSGNLGQSDVPDNLLP